MMDAVLGIIISYVFIGIFVNICQWAARKAGTCLDKRALDRFNESVRAYNNAIDGTAKASSPAEKTAAAEVLKKAEAEWAAADSALNRRGRDKFQDRK